MRWSKTITGDGPMLRCRVCGTVTREPIEHAQYHYWPPTVATVWEHFALVGAKRPEPRAKEDDDTPQEDALF